MFFYGEYNTFCSLPCDHGIFCDKGSRHLYDGSWNVVFRCCVLFYGMYSNSGRLIFYYGIFCDKGSKHLYDHPDDTPDDGLHGQTR